VLAAPAIVSAQGTYPNKAVRYINPFPAGGATDTLSRLLCAKMADLSGQQWIVENKSGSGGNVGMEALAQSAPDGYTLGLGGIASHAIAPTLYAKLPFKVPGDFTFVTTMWQLPNMLVVNLDVPAKTVAELIALLKASPAKYSYASAGNGTTLHLSGELFKVMAKVDMLHVPYRGAAPAVTDVATGAVTMSFTSYAAALPLIQAGKIRAVAVTSLDRMPQLPDVAPLQEAVPGLKGYELLNWFGVFAPGGTPAPIVARLNEIVVKTFTDPEMVKKLSLQGIVPRATTPAQFKAFVEAESKKFASIIERANIKAPS
jgi:tripartite-type tricarboxylate transporter receptor subunit TctC